MAASHLQHLEILLSLITGLIHCAFLTFRYKFDDERVTKEDTKRALDEQYGGEEEVFVLFFVTLLLILSYSLHPFYLYLFSILEKLHT